MTKLIKGYRHTGIVVKNMEESLFFYKDLLGFEIIQDYHDDSDYINTLLNLEGATVHMVKLKSMDDITLELLYYPNTSTDPHNLPIYNIGICHLFSNT